MGILDDVRRLLGGRPITGNAAPRAGVAQPLHPSAGEERTAEDGPDAPRWESTATAPPSFAGSDSSSTPGGRSVALSGGAHSSHPGASVSPTRAVQVLTQGPLTDLKRIAKYLTSVGIDSQLIMPPGGCGT